MRKRVLAALGGLLLVAACSMGGTAPGTASDVELKGKDVVDMRGDTVGEIKDVQGQNAVVAVGGFLGLGEKEVMIPKDRLTPLGSGSARKFQTNMTKEQIRDLADVRRSPTPSERASPPPPAPPPPAYR